MNRIYTRDQIAHMSADKTITSLDRKTVTVTLQGADFPARLHADQDGTAIVVFDTPGIYFGENKVEIASPLFNNFTAHVLERLAVKA